MTEVKRNRDTIQRLRRIEGQIKGIQRMIEEERACDEVMTQVMAARAALDQVDKQVVIDHIDTCLSTLPPDRAKATISRAIDMLGRIPPSPTLDVAHPGVDDVAQPVADHVDGKHR